MNKLSGREVPGGLAWGLLNKEAEAPEGWREDLLEFHNYGGPGNVYEGKGKLTPRLKDIICSYFFLFLLGVDQDDDEGGDQGGDEVLPQQPQTEKGGTLASGTC